jgi:hypothetical protein
MNFTLISGQSYFYKVLPTFNCSGNFMILTDEAKHLIHQLEMSIIIEYFKSLS